MDIKTKYVVCLLAFGWIQVSGLAFSPYENYLLSGKETHVALLARVKPEQESALIRTLERFHEKKAVSRLRKAHIRNLAAFQKEINDTTYCMLYFDYEGGKGYLGAARAFESSCPEAAQLTALIEPHPLARRYGSQWLQMEWITFIRGKDVKDKPARLIAMVTRIKPEKEMEYRMLHQGVWPGVVDQMDRANNRNFSIFLAELEGELYEFFYYEYVGIDPEKDEALYGSDPTNRRWWKHTDPCQKPLPELKSEDIWAPMEQIGR